MFTRFLDFHPSLVVAIVMMTSSSLAHAEDPFLAQAALEMGEIEIARDLYEGLHADGSAEASFILSAIHRYGLLGEKNIDLANQYRDVAADRGHPEAIAEICVDAGNRERAGGRFSGLLEQCWLGAQQGKYHDFFTIYSDEFTFEMSRYYAARALEQSDERGLAFLCYMRVWRDIHDERSDMRHETAKLEAWETTKNRLLQHISAANLGVDMLGGNTDITENEFRKWEPCRMSGVEAVRLMIEFHLDLR